MCGICGIVNTGNNAVPDTELLKSMMRQLVHRGPDACGYYRDRNAALGHLRLSIIDLESGAQPLANEDQSIWISFNGEIFNYIELREELTGLGHRFSTKSDTEAIIHAYEEWGTSCFSRFNGQWALALWNCRDKSLLISRDRMGIRPLYYTFAGPDFLFASEVKALFAHPSVSREFDPAGINEIFTFWSPVAKRTAFKNIEELPPGTFALLRNGKLYEEQYWSIDFPPKNSESEGSLEDNAAQLKHLLVQATRLRFTRSDVPVGAYLSGGIDSSITSAIVSHYTDSPVKTFSLRFEDNEFDEGMYQSMMVKKLGSDHQDVIVSVKDIGEQFPDVIWHAERPILRTAPAPLFMLSGLVRKAGYKVVVTGEGADEVLAGYDIFREAKVRSFLAADPSSLKRQEIVRYLYPWMERSPGKTPAFAGAFFKKSLSLSDPAISHRPRWETTASLASLLSNDFRNRMEKHNIADDLLQRLPQHHMGWESLSRSQWLEMKTLLSGYILAAQGDRMLMGNSVEGRFPFLDRDVVSFSNNLKARYKLMGLNEKYILKAAFKDMIPEEILFRPKQPYRAPDAASFFWNTDRSWVDELTCERAINEAGIFNSKTTELLISKCRKVRGMKMSNTDNMRITAIVSTMLVYEQFIKQNPASLKNPPLPVSVRVIDRISPVD
jgi:asparagine synthase (glutamine-hydrolysing)